MGASPTIEATCEEFPPLKTAKYVSKAQHHHHLLQDWKFPRAFLAIFAVAAGPQKCCCKIFLPSQVICTWHTHTLRVSCMAYGSTATCKLQCKLVRNRRELEGCLEGGDLKGGTDCA